MSPKHLLLSLNLALLFTACSKQKAQTIEGTLLLCRTDPRRMANKSVEVYQSIVSGYYFSGGGESLARGTTDATGHFRIRFKPGKVDYLFGSGTNETPLVLRSAENDTSFPKFLRTNFASSDYANKPIYIGKLIDTLIIHIKFTVELLPADTIQVYVPTLGRKPTKSYWGRQASAGSEVLLDTFYQAFATSFDELKQKYGMPAILGKRSLVPAGYIFTWNFYPYPEMLKPEDERRVDVFFNWDQ